MVTLTFYEYTQKVGNIHAGIKLSQELGEVPMMSEVAANEAPGITLTTEEVNG